MVSLKLLSWSISAGVVLIGVVLVATWTAGTASGSPGLNVSDTEETSSPLPKAAASSKMRLILAVGIEGTGHDYVLNVDDNLFQKNDNLTRLDGHAASQVGRYHVKRSMGQSAHHYSSVINSGRAQMRKLAEREAKLPFPGTVVIVHAKYSYPDGHGPDKAMRYLDLRLLAEAAEAEGVDFRVLYLQRSAKDIVVANTMHRRFQE